MNIHVCNTSVRYADHSATRGHFHKLQELLQDFVPVISRKVDKISQDIEGEYEANAIGNPTY